MLVLTRAEGQKIVVGEHIEITVVQIDRGRVRIGITAPKGVSIVRKELIDGQDPTERGDGK